MAHIPVKFGSGSGNGSDDCTAKSNEVLTEKTAITADSDDEVIVGTMPNIAATEEAKSIVISDGNLLVRMSNGAHITNADSGYPEVSIAGENLGDAAAVNIVKGKKATSKNGIAITGTLEPNSLTSFDAAVSSDKAVVLTWKVPEAKIGRPYCGIHVRYKTGSAPTSPTDGTAIYTGNGGVSTAGATVTATVTMPAFATKYYFSAWVYATTNADTLYSSSYLTASCTTASTKSYTYTSSNTLMVPNGFKYMDIFCVGGGGGGGYHSRSNNLTRTGGGGGGYTKTVKNYSVAAGQSLTITVGAGGTATTTDSSADGTDGGSSSVKVGSAEICSASGGTGGGKSGKGGAGGSGGGSGGGDGGSDGGDGGKVSGTAGTGQGSTTRTWGGTTGTVYSGGGGGGGYQNIIHGDNDDGEANHIGINYYLTAGGNYGGGKGGVMQTDIDSGYHHRYTLISHAVAGTANSGGGGGGGTSADSSNSSQIAKGANGGSGIVLLKFHN